MVSTTSAQNLPIEHVSLSTTRIELLNAGKPETIGTGFFYMRPESEGRVILFLVTNHHVFSGFPPGDARKPLGDEIRFWCHKSLEQPGDVVEYRFPLYAKDGRPRWLSSQSTKDADIAVLPLPPSIGAACKVVALSPDTNAGAPMPRLRPSSAVAIVGYPYGFFDQANHIPIWKTGAIASEPAVDFGGRPVILVDASLFPGMSGSPVFAVTSGTYESVDGPMIVGRKTPFLGVFSAIRTLNETKLVEPFQAPQRLKVEIQQTLELGYVWRESLVREIVQGFDAENYQKEFLQVP